MKTLNFIGIFFLIVLTSCVSQKKYSELESKTLKFENSLRLYENENEILKNNFSNEKNKVRKLENQLDYFKSTNTNLLDRLYDLSVVSKTGAESIKKSLESLNEQNKYIKNLTTSMLVKDSLNLVLVMNLKRSLADFNDDDVTIEVKKGVVYVSISDKMLFKSGSYNLNEHAKQLIGKVANIINDHSELDVLVEGHTDNVPIYTECLLDNWDLSVKRATSIVRLMQTKFNVEPYRMTAGGRAEYIPKRTNETVEGRAINRRTEIIILPKLDQFFTLLEPPKRTNKE